MEISNTHFFDDPALAAGPTQRILRLVEIKVATLADSMLQAATFGANHIVDRLLGNEVTLVGGAPSIMQERGVSLRPGDRR